MFGLDGLFSTASSGARVDLAAASAVQRGGFTTAMGTGSQKPHRRIKR